MAKSLCYPGIKAKFEQNPFILEVLSSTGNKIICESCKDTLWGTGLALHEDTALDQTKWTNQGLMGEILMQIRHEFTVPGDNTS